MLLRLMFACLLVVSSVSACGPKSAAPAGDVVRQQSLQLPPVVAAAAAAAAESAESPEALASVSAEEGDDGCAKGALCDRAACRFVTTDRVVGTSGAVLQEHTCVHAGHPCQKDELTSSGKMVTHACHQFRQRVLVDGQAHYINSSCGCVRKRTLT